MKKNKKIVLIVEKTNTGFSAYSNSLPIYTTAMTIPELLNNAYESSELYYENENDSLIHYDIKLEVDFQQFFQYYKVLNAKFLAEKIGMNPTLLSHYVQGRKKPSEKQTNKILDGIHKIGQELIDINLIKN